MPNQSHFSRPVKKVRPEDNEFRVRRPQRVAIKPVMIGNQPRGAYYTAVDHKFVVLDVAIKGRRR